MYRQIPPPREAAAASEELASQAQLLQEQVGRFKLRINDHSKTYNGTEKTNPKVLKMSDAEHNDKKSEQTRESNEEGLESVPRKIVLCDEEFGKY